MLVVLDVTVETGGEMKYCYKCKSEKNHDNFRKDKSRKDGFANKCKECCDKYSKVYFLGHHDELRQYAKNYYKTYFYDPVSVDNKKYELRKFKLAQRSARDRNKEFTLTLEEYSQLVYENCYYCNNILGQKPIQGVGLDRLDNSKGYVTDNCVSCCMICNQLKMDTLTVQEAKAAVKAVINVRYNKIIEAEID